MKASWRVRQKLEMGEPWEIGRNLGQDGKFSVIQGTGGERVLDAEAGNLLARVQIFREEACGAAVGCGGDDERIPEAYPRFVFDAEGH
jgi:hypothetical protein